MEFDLASVEKMIHDNLRTRFSPTVFQLWFSELELIEMSSQHMEFCVNGDFKCQTLNTRYFDTIKEAVAEVVGFEIPIHIISSTVQKECVQKGDDDPRLPTPLQQEEMEIGMKIEGQSIVEEYTFENFIVGESNKFAHAACVAVANKQDTYNPLFIYGPSGNAPSFCHYQRDQEKGTLGALRI